MAERDVNHFYPCVYWLLKTIEKNPAQRNLESQKQYFPSMFEKDKQSTPEEAVRRIQKVFYNFFQNLFKARELEVVTVGLNPNVVILPLLNSFLKDKAQEKNITYIKHFSETGVFYIYYFL